jgi:hypothetical protein
MINIENLTGNNYILKCYTCNESENIKNIYFYNKTSSKCIRLCSECRKELLNILLKLREE